MDFEYVIIGLDDGLVPDRRQAIIWANDGLVQISLKFVPKGQISDIQSASRN